MTRLSSKGVIYVEGADDKYILSKWFPHLLFEDAKGKDNVPKRVDQNQASFGLLDRDFYSTDEVEASREDHSRLVILRRYCIENYLLDPAIIADVAQRLNNTHAVLSSWSEENFVYENLFKWANEYATYAAANKLVSEWKQAVETDFRRYFDSLPVQSYDEVLSTLKERVGRIPSSHEIDTIFQETHAQISQDFSTLEGVHRWIDGKFMLEKLLYQNVFNPIHNFGQNRLRDELIESGKTRIPDELVQLAKKWQPNQ